MKREIFLLTTFWLKKKEAKFDVMSLSWKEECKGDGFPHQSCRKKEVENCTIFLDPI